MTRTFTKKEKEEIKRLVRRMKLEVFRIRFPIGVCNEDNVIPNCIFLLEKWDGIIHNRRSVFFRLFCGMIRELLIEIKGNVCEPYLNLICFADRKKIEKEKQDLKHLVFLSWIRVTKATKPRTIELEEIPDDDVDRILDELMLPCVRVVKPNERLEGIVESFQYNRRFCSRTGIVSKRGVEREMAMER